METPCQDVCRINQATRLCEGCMRTIDEIAAWGQMSADERRRIMAELPARWRGARPAVVSGD